MPWFGQGRDTIEWQEFRDDVLFYKWPANEIKRGSRLIIRAGQKAIFYANGSVEGVFANTGNFDIASEIVPFLSTLKGVLSMRSDSGLRAEVYFVNSKELLLPWGTRQRIMIPTPEVPSGIPVGCNGNLIVEFRDYQRFIEKVAGVKDTYSLSDIAERILGELNPVVAEAILDGQQSIGVNALVALQQNSRRLGKKICQELDQELQAFGLGVSDVNINSINYPPEVQKMAEKVAGQSFVNNVGRYAAVSMADGLAAPGNGGIAGMGAQIAMGAQLAQQMSAAMASPVAPQPAAETPRFACTSCDKTSATPMNFCPKCGKPMKEITVPTGGENFCPKCRKMVTGKFCADCGTPTV